MSPDLLTDPTTLPLRDAASVAELGPTLVVAPHPDDESLGCGGLIALLRQRELPVVVVVVSDGTASHPGSRRYSKPALRALRESEAVTALRLLGVASECTIFLGLSDGAVAARGAEGFDAAVASFRGRLAALAPAFVPATVALPWRRDPHCDHQAAAQIARAALGGAGPLPRLLEYPIWAWALAAEGAAPRRDEVAAWRLDIGAVLPAKLAAIAAHRSQTTDLIDDDPDGFQLTPAVLTHFSRDWELYLEARA